MVGINTGLVSAAESPFGGVKGAALEEKGANTVWPSTRTLSLLQLAISKTRQVS